MLELFNTVTFDLRDPVAMSVSMTEKAVVFRLYVDYPRAFTFADLLSLLEFSSELPCPDPKLAVLLRAAIGLSDCA